MTRRNVLAVDVAREDDSSGKTRLNQVQFIGAIRDTNRVGRRRSWRIG